MAQEEGQEKKKKRPVIDEGMSRCRGAAVIIMCGIRRG